MSELEKRILEFLMGAAVYSEQAICKNLGIDMEELQQSFISLERQGYLESYESFLKREQLNEKNVCPPKHSCSSCGNSCSSCGSAGNAKEDYSNVRVLTEKAVEEFYCEELERRD